MLAASTRISRASRLGGEKLALSSRQPVPRFASTTSASRSGGRRYAGAVTGTVAAVSAAAISYHLSSSPIQNDAPASAVLENKPLSDGPNPVGEIVTLTDSSQQTQMRDRSKSQGVYAWGSNRYNVVAPDSPQTTLVKTPRSIPFFDGMALRDVVLEEKHAVAVDAHGDVVQWGLGFFDPTSRVINDNLEEAPLGRRREKERANELSPRGSEAAKIRDPVKTLTGKNIVKVAANDDKVYALGKNGDLYIISAIQQLQARPPGSSSGWSANPLTLFGTFAGSEIDYAKVKLAPSSSLARGDKLAHIAAGNSHLVALSAKGRTFTLPINEQGNAFGQLGFRRVLLNAPATADSKSGLVETILEPRMLAQLENPQSPPNVTTVPVSRLPPPSTESGRTSVPQPPPAATTTEPAPAPAPLTEPSSSIRYCTTLSELPSLKQVSIAEIAVGHEHNLARTDDGRVLAWGRHTHGQLGLGANFSLECVPVPSEVVVSRFFSNASRDVKCTGLAAGGDNSFFITERSEINRIGTGRSVDVLSAGKGQWGTLGNGMWSQVKPDPSRVKTVSGLMEFSELSNLIHPVPIHSISVGKPGHVALVLDTVDDPTKSSTTFGRDVMVFGHNAAYQLGTGKRSNLSVPQHLHPLPTPSSSNGSPQLSVEADINSGSLTHMPHNRLQLTSQVKGNTKVDEKKNKKNVQLQEVISAGTVSMAVWWKVEP
ncbi:unnamed protein product [Sympodiomycopsis kandeliae]